MNKITSNFTEIQQQLLKIVYSKMFTCRVKIRAMAINIYLNGNTNKKTAQTLCISDKSLIKYIKIFNKKGILGLCQENPYRPKSDLANFF